MIHILLASCADSFADSFADTYQQSGHCPDLTCRLFTTSVHLRLENLEAMLTSTRINCPGEQFARNMTATATQSEHGQGLTRSELEAQTLNLEPRV